jgi:hypothetical protein
VNANPVRGEILSGDEDLNKLEVANIETWLADTAEAGEPRLREFAT